MFVPFNAVLLCPRALKNSLESSVLAACRVATAEMGGAERERWTQRVVKHHAFDLFFTLVVITNSLFIGVELQIRVDSDEDSPIFLQVMLYLYTSLFLIELWFRIAADRWKYLFGEDWAWAWLDIFIVLTSLWEVAFEARLLWNPLIIVLDKWKPLGTSVHFASYQTGAVQAFFEP